MIRLTHPRAPRAPRRSRRRTADEKGAVLVVAAFAITNKVYSPQYVLWLLPLAAMARPRWPLPSPAAPEASRSA